MAVNKVIYNGRTLIDISDSTANAENTLQGTVGYSADGEKFIGTASVSSLYATGRKETVIFPVSGWTASGDVYTQSVAANVNGEKAITQILLSEDVYTRLSELEADSNLVKVEVLSGSVRVTIAEKPEVALKMEIAIINGLAASSKSALMCLDGEGFVFALRANAWTKSGNTYTQTRAVDGLTDGIIFGDALLDDEDSTAETELAEARTVAKFEVSNGSIKAICYGYPPEKDLQYFIKVFSKE